MLHDEGIVKVSGEVGSGKTMLCRVLMERLPAHVETIYLATPSLARDEILHAIADDLDAQALARARARVALRELQEHLIGLYAAGRRVVILIDEAHVMPEETLEQVRLLSNLESNRHKLLQIVLFGQPELDATLAKPSLRQLRDRITHSLPHAAARRAPRSANYVSFRMRAAGYRGPEVFAPRALRADRARLGGPHAAHQHPCRQGAARRLHREHARRHRPARARRRSPTRSSPRCARRAAPGALRRGARSPPASRSARARAVVAVFQPEPSRAGAGRRSAAPPARRAAAAPRAAQTAAAGAATPPPRSRAAGAAARRLAAERGAGGPARRLLAGRPAAARASASPRRASCSSRAPDERYAIELFITENTDPARMERFLLRARDLVPLEDAVRHPDGRRAASTACAWCYGEFASREAALEAARRLPPRYQEAFRTAPRSFAELRGQI